MDGLSNEILVMVVAYCDVPTHFALSKVSRRFYLMTVHTRFPLVSIFEEDARGSAVLPQVASYPHVQAHTR